MTYRSIEDINNEINEVKLLLNPLTDFLIKNPNDLSVKANANSLKDRLHQLNVELAHVKNYYGRTSFDFRIANDNGGKIELSNLSKIGSAIQELVNSCSMYDGKTPVKKKSSINNSILSSAVLQVDAVEMGSLILFVSSANNQSSLNNESYLKRGLENLNDIISCGDNEELLLDKMKTMGTQPIFKYKNLLKILKNNKLNLDMYKSVAPKGFEPQCLSSEFAKKVYEVIDDYSKEKSDTIDIMGELYIIDTHRNVCSLEISSEEGNELKNIKFSFDKKFKENLKNNIEETIHVILNRIIEYNPIEDNEKITYKLKDIL